MFYFKETQSKTIDVYNMKLNILTNITFDRNDGFKSDNVHFKA